MVVLDAAKEEDDKDMPMRIFDSNINLQGSVDIRPPRGILQVSLIKWRI